jgi:DNA invertase Pin-like site-specific DNA recombinase/uncharacterized protein YukE
MLSHIARVATYVRWSTDEQGDGTTLAVQLEACRLFIQSQGWPLSDDLLFVDDGCSGGSLDRPGLNRLRAAVRRGEINCVVVYKLDRLSRSVLDTVTLVLQEWDGICAVRSTREPVDTTSPTGSILFYMLASYAEWERSTIRERTLSGKIKRAQQGRNPGFTPPYGYRKGDQPGEWRIDEDEAVIVRRIFREYIVGKGTGRIADGLNADGIKPRKVARFNGLWLNRLIQNPAYMGVLRYGMSTLATKAQRMQGASARVRLGAPRYAEVAGAIPVIIATEQFAQAQRLRQGRSGTAGFRNRGAAFLLSGLVRCRCGAPLRGDGRGKSGARGQSGAGRYYRCDHCACSLIPAALLEVAVVARVGAALAPDTGLLLASENLERTQAVGAEMGRLKAALNKLGHNRARMDRDYQNGELPAKLYAAHVEQLDSQAQALAGALASLSDELQQLGSAATAVADPADPADSADPDDPPDPWAHLSLDEQKQLLRHAIGRCVVYRAPGRGGEIQIELEIRRSTARATATATAAATAASTAPAAAKATARGAARHRSGRARRRKDTGIFDQLFDHVVLQGTSGLLHDIGTSHLLETIFRVSPSGRGRNLPSRGAEATAGGVGC